MLFLIILLYKIYNIIFQKGQKLTVIVFFFYKTVTENMAVWNNSVNKPKSKNYNASSLKKTKLTKNVFILKIIYSHWKITLLTSRLSYNYNRRTTKSILREHTLPPTFWKSYILYTRYLHGQLFIPFWIRRTTGFCCFLNFSIYNYFCIYCCSKPVLFSFQFGTRN